MVRMVANITLFKAMTPAKLKPSMASATPIAGKANLVEAVFLIFSPYCLFIKTSIFYKTEVSLSGNLKNIPNNLHAERNVEYTIIMKLIGVKSYEEMSMRAAGMVADRISRKPSLVLGLATGSTPVGLYENLIQLNKAGKVDFRQVTTFNLDEYCGLKKSDPQSYRYFMNDKLFNHINIELNNTHLLSGTAKDLEFECENYEKAIQKAGGIDLQILGVGSNGHIGFNEPDEVFHNQTRQVELTPSTICANKRFFEKEEDVPKTALSMGMGTIMAAREILLVAGADKRAIMEKLKEKTVSPKLPVSLLHYHPNCTIFYVEE